MNILTWIHQSIMPWMGWYLAVGVFILLAGAVYDVIKKNTGLSPGDILEYIDESSPMVLLWPFLIVYEIHLLFKRRGKRRA